MTVSFNIPTGTLLAVKVIVADWVLWEAGTEMGIRVQKVY